MKPDIHGLLNSIPSGIVKYQYRDGVLHTLYCSDFFLEMLGKSKEEYHQGILEDWKGNIYEQDLPIVQRAINECVFENKKIDIFYRLRHKNGSLIWVNLQAVNIGEEGGYPTMHAVFQNMSKYTELYRHLLDDMDTIVQVFDKETKEILYVNHAAEVFTGISHQNAIGKKCHCFMFGDEQPCEDCDIACVDENGRIREFVHGDRYYMVQSKKVFWNDKEAIASYYNDITSQKEAEWLMEERAMNLDRKIMELVKNTRNLENAAIKANVLYWTMDVRTGDVHAKDMDEDSSIGNIDGMNIYDDEFARRIIKDEDIPIFRKEVDKIRSGKERHTSFDVRARFRGAKKGRWARITLDSVLDDEGKLTAILGIGQDVTVQKQLEQRYNEAVQYRDTTAKGLIASCRVNLTKNIVEDLFVKETDVSRKEYERLTDYVERSKTYMKECGISDRDRELCSPEELLRMFESGIEPTPVEYIATMRCSEKVIWVRTEVKIVSRPETGEIVAFFYDWDITEEFIYASATAAMIQFNCDYCAVIFKSSHHAHILKTEENTVLPEDYYENYEEAIENFLLNNCPPDEAEEVIKKIKMDVILEALERDTVYTIDYRLIEPDGRIRRKQLRYMYNNKEAGVLVQTRIDVDDMVQEEMHKQQQLQNALDAAEEANNAKSDFLSRMSHDIRTPMNVIIGMVEMALENTNNPAETRDCLEKIETSSKFLLGLINDILDVSKIESGALRLNPEPYIFEEFENQVNLMIRPLCEQRRLKFYLHTDIKPELCILADKVRFNQIFFNLLSNAVKFTNPGGTVELTVQRCLQKGAGKKPSREAFVFSVKDNGIGMSEEFQRNMFDPFSQEENKHVKETSGSGLGLSIVKHLVELMGGTLEVKSRLGVGSEFIVCLDFEVCNPPEEGKITRKDNSTISLEGTKALVCEDHTVNAQIAKRLLEKAGMEVVVAENGQVGLELFEQSAIGEFDIILMDIRMPVMDGLETTKAIRELYRLDASSVPIIAMTADAFDTDRKKTIEAGMNGHISKPIEPRVLYETLHNVLQK